MRYWLFVITFLLVSAAYSQSPDSLVQEIPGTNVKLTFIKIPAGNYLMGSPARASLMQPDETPQRSIKLDEFYLDRFELDYMAFDAFTKDKKESLDSEADAVTRPTVPYIDLTAGMGKSMGYPANSMQFYNAIMFCRWLYKKTGIFYRLPTEAEWEYACRAGSKTIFPFGDDSTQLKDYAWYFGNSNGEYHLSGQLKPNAWGLYDMLGNVQEWTLDQYDSTYYAKEYDSTRVPLNIPKTKHPQSLRGGTYLHYAKDVRSANRLVSSPIWNRRDPQVPKSKWWNADAPFVGMRLLRPVKQPTPEQAETFYRTFLIK